MAEIEREEIGTIMSNFDHEINDDVAERVMQRCKNGEDVCGTYPAWDFHGLVWWNPTEDKWCVEIWRYKILVEIIVADTPARLMEYASEKYGAS